jgi:transcriptional regulator with XRE-family HTH domain
MDGRHVGPLFRAVRRRRGLRQADVAQAAGVARSTVSNVERGHWRRLSFDSLERLGRPLDIRLDVSPRWRGGDADRLLNRAHSTLAESFAAWLATRPGWVIEPEVSFSILGERGVIDQMGWHGEAGHLAVIELKTELVDVNELLGTFDRKVRLARRVAAERGWAPRVVSGWLVILDTHTNRRHAAAHRALLRTRFPADGRQLAKFARQPGSATFGIAFWPDANPRGLGRGVAPGKSRIVPRKASPGPNSASTDVEMARKGPREAQPRRLADGNLGQVHTD